MLGFVFRWCWWYLFKTKGLVTKVLNIFSLYGGRVSSSYCVRGYEEYEEYESLYQYWLSMDCITLNSGLKGWRPATDRKNAERQICATCLFFRYSRPLQLSIGLHLQSSMSKSRVEITNGIVSKEGIYQISTGWPWPEDQITVTHWQRIRSAQSVPENK